jgi:hypothetical protein
MSAVVGPRPTRFSITALALLVPWVALVIDAWRPIGDSSFLWHIRAGSVQAEAGNVLTSDPFSFTRHGQEWLTQSWLAELTYAAGERLAGLGFVPWMMLTVSALIFTGIALIAYRESRSVPAAAFSIILSTLLLISFLVPRPVVFSFLLFVLVVLAWDRDRSKWMVPFLFWIWASTHGSFVVGLGYVGLTLIMRKEWRHLPSAVVCGLATLVTAHGLGVLNILLNFGEAREALTFISEWRRPAFSDPSFLALVGGVAFVAIGVLGGKVRARHFWIIIPFVTLATTSIRALPPAWIGLLPIVAGSLADLSIGSKPRFGPVAAVVFTITVLILPFFLREDGGLRDGHFPVAAEKELDDVPTYHDDRVGGYLIYSQGPDRLVYIDDRAELYGERMEEFVNVRDGEQDWRPVFARDGIEQALLGADSALADRLVAAGWVEHHHDEEYMVLRPG